MLTAGKDICTKQGQISAKVFVVKEDVHILAA